MISALSNWITPARLALMVAFIGPFFLSGYSLTLLNYIGLYSIVAVGMVVLTGIGGLTSFGQAAFVGLGAYATAVLSATYGLSPWFGLMMSLLVTGLVAAFLGVITLRLSGHYLPLGTLAWGLAIYYLFGNIPLLGGSAGIDQIPAIQILEWSFESSSDIGVIIWLILAAAMWLVSNLLNSKEGRIIRGLPHGDVMLESMGINTYRSKLFIFLFAALLAAVSGWLYAHMQRFINPTPFSAIMGIEYLFMIVLGGAASLSGALFGAAFLVLMKYWLQDFLPQLFGNVGNFETIFFGVLVILVLQFAKSGIWPLLLSAVTGRAAPGKSEGALFADDHEDLVLPIRPPNSAGEILLHGKELTKKFGGLVANNKMTISVEAGGITALIGPNGAGKSTLFNMLTGVAAPSHGEVHYFGEKTDEISARTLSRRGVSRTFQHVQLIPELTVLENVALGASSRTKSGFVRACLHLEREEEKRIFSEAKRQLLRVGLEGQSNLAAGMLPLGQQRIVEIARALATDPRVLLLDEPAAGLRFYEKEELAQLLSELKEEGIGVLLVEHDMDFVMGLADRIVAMEFGERLADGTPEEIQNHPAVLEAYLGGVE